MSYHKIAVIGSSNTDMVVQSDHLPLPGETVLGHHFVMNPGGKGANQAVAAARLGGAVIFCARVGNDLFGQQAIAGFKKDGIDVQFVTADEEKPSGVALILVDKQGENSISVALGANESLRPAHIDPMVAQLEAGSLILVQLETPMETIQHVAHLARKHRFRLILNPAPARELPADVLQDLFMITPNSIEAAMLSGVAVTDEKTARTAAQALRIKGVQHVIITMGGAGAYVSSESMDELIPAIPCPVVDTTAAGDTFNGALTVGLNEGMTLKEAIQFGHQAAAYSVGILGAQSSIPTRQNLSSPS